MWKVLVVDDEEDVHVLTKLAYKSFSFKSLGIEVISAYSASQAREKLLEHTDIALILLDVVMETETAGLELIKYIREDLDNHLVRIVIRTGQPGYAPEKDVIYDYDINDYKEKTELVAQKFYTMTLSALRSFYDLLSLEEKQHELEQQANTFAKFVPKEFLQHLSYTSLSELKPGEFTAKDMYVMFVDLHAFTELSETLSSEETFLFLNEWLSRIEPLVRKHGGFVDKYLGDGIMALFDANDVAGVIDAALDIIHAVETFNAEMKVKLHFPLSVGIGINTGRLIMGTVGSSERMDCTAISDAVNVAARLEAYSGMFGANVLVTKEIHRSLPRSDNYEVRNIGRIRFRGKTESANVFEIYSADDEKIRQAKSKTKLVFEKGILYYQKGNFDKAKDEFNAVLSENSEDVVAQLYLERIRFYEKRGIPSNWPGLLDPIVSY